jgi:hypothetical protein
MKDMARSCETCGGVNSEYCYSSVVNSASTDRSGATASFGVRPTVGTQN